METMKKLSLFLLSGLVAGCGVTQRVQIGPVRPALTDSPTPIFVSGVLPLTDGSNLDLNTLSRSPLVLIFASDTCDVCAAEVKAIRESLTKPNEAPNRVAVVNAVVSVRQDDAAQWKLDHRIPWSVGFDEKLALFKQWCGPGSVPCTVVQVPERGIVLTHRGEITPAELEKLTGPLEKQP